MTNKATDVLLQLKVLLENLDNNSYSSELRVLSSSTIGKHTRHIIEFFKCLLKQSSTGVVNYDIRERDPQIERTTATAIDAIAELIKGLKQLSELNIPLKLVTGDGLEAEHEMDSSLEREIWYNIEHAIHHMAIIKMAVRHEFPGVVIDDEFGVAHSTLSYMKSNDLIVNN